jgi:hypothetical protein
VDDATRIDMLACTEAGLAVLEADPAVCFRRPADPSGWVPHELTRGPRKGQMVWKKGSSYRDEPPPGAEGGDQPAEAVTPAGAPPVPKGAEAHLIGEKGAALVRDIRTGVHKASQVREFVGSLRGLDKAGLETVGRRMGVVGHVKSAADWVQRISDKLGYEKAISSERPIRSTPTKGEAEVAAVKLDAATTRGGRLGDVHAQQSHVAYRAEEILSQRDPHSASLNDLLHTIHVMKDEAALLAIRRFGIEAKDGASAKKALKDRLVAHYRQSRR